MGRHGAAQVLTIPSSPPMVVVAGAAAEKFKVVENLVA